MQMLCALLVQKDYMEDHDRAKTEEKFWVVFFPLTVQFIEAKETPRQILSSLFL